MDPGLRARMQSRILNELINAKKKIENIIDTDKQLKQSVDSLDFSTINKQTINTKNFADHILAVMKNDRKKHWAHDDVINIFKLVACGQLSIQEKKEVVEAMGLKESNRLRLLRQLDRYEDEDTYVIGIRNVNFYAYSSEEIHLIKDFFATVFYDNLLTIANVKEELRKLEDEYNINNIGLISHVLFALNPTEFYIIDDVAKQGMWKLFGTVIPNNPYNYPDLDEIFYSIKYKLGLSHYGQLDYILTHL